MKSRKVHRDRSIDETGSLFGISVYLVYPSIALQFASLRSALLDSRYGTFLLRMKLHNGMKFRFASLHVTSLMMHNVLTLRNSMMLKPTFPQCLAPQCLVRNVESPQCILKGCFAISAICEDTSRYIHAFFILDKADSFNITQNDLRLSILRSEVKDAIAKSNVHMR